METSIKKIALKLRRSVSGLRFLYLYSESAKVYWSTAAKTHILRAAVLDSTIPTTLAYQPEEESIRFRVHFPAHSIKPVWRVALSGASDRGYAEGGQKIQGGKTEQRKKPDRGGVERMTDVTAPPHRWKYVIFPL